MGTDSTPATPADAAAPSDQDQVKPPASSAKFRYGVKTSLSLTLAYLIPMAIGWPQPQTAATTVMLIAATGLLSESLQKGVSRILGTVAGAIIGLSLIALFPQDRMIYLLAVSITVSTIIYLYNAYQGDSTVFMLTAVVTLMVFNGGDAEGAFPSKDAEIALRMAKAQSSDAFAFASDRAIQFHGGFGFTYECDAQLFLRRALWCQSQYGDALHHRKHLADLIL